MAFRGIKMSLTLGGLSFVVALGVAAGWFDSALAYAQPGGKGGIVDRPSRKSGGTERPRDNFNPGNEVPPEKDSGDSSSDDSRSPSPGAPAVQPGKNASPTEEPEPQLFRHGKSDVADAPSGRLLLRVPGAGNPPSSTPQVEGEEPPTEPGDPNSENENGEGGPSFFDEPMGTRMVFVIDCSLTMRTKDGGEGEDYNGDVVASMSRLMVVKTELIRFLIDMEENCEFDIVWLAGGTGEPGQGELPNAPPWQGKLVKCTPAIRDLAIQTVKDQITWPNTPTWRALKNACELYPDDIDTMVHLTDGYPQNSHYGEWGQRKHADAVLEDFPKWYEGKKRYGCKLIGILVGHLGIDKAEAFMQHWCVDNEAVFIHK